MKIHIIKKQKNISKYFLGKTKGFTLVELIIVITILAILATIAFISFKSYSGNARDGNRISTLSSIQKGLDIYQVKVGKFPNPDDIYGIGIYQTGSINETLSYVGNIKENISKGINMNKTPLDPKMGKEYVYGVSADYQKYQIASSLEELEANAIISTTYASQTKAKVVGNYKYPLRLGNKLYSLPSLIFIGTGDLLNNSTGFIINNGGNLPYSLDGKVLNNTQNIIQQLKDMTGKDELSLTGVDISGIKKEDLEGEDENEMAKSLGLSNEEFKNVVFGRGSSYGGKSEESTGDNGDFNVVTKYLPTISLNTVYSFTIPLSWWYNNGIDLEQLSFNLKPLNSQGLFYLNNNVINGNVSEAKQYTFELVSYYQGKIYGKLLLKLNTDGWYIDSDGVVHCLNIPQGEKKIINGKEYESVRNLGVTRINYGQVCTSNVTTFGTNTFGTPYATTMEFNGDITHFDTSNITTMEGLFRSNKIFNQDIGHWNTSKVTNMKEVFYGATEFNQDISKWDVSNTITMEGMLRTWSNFNYDISHWNTSKVTNMNRLFFGVKRFNQDISKWDTSNVTSMEGMFDGASDFNQDISKWDVSKVTAMMYMFRWAFSFNQDLSKWCVNKITTKPYSFDESTSSWESEKKPVWGTCPE